MPPAKPTVVRWPAFVAAIPLLIVIFAPQLGLSPYLAVAIAAAFAGLGVFLSLPAAKPPLRLGLTVVGVAVAAGAAGLLVFLGSLRR